MFIAGGVVEEVDGHNIPVVSQHYRPKVYDEFYLKGVEFVAAAGAQTFYDWVISTNSYVHGGKCWVDSAAAAMGDKMHWSVVDKDDVLGLFSVLGLTQGVDVLEVSKYVEDYFVPPGITHGWVDAVRPETHALVPAGLYLRASYESVGLLPVQVILQYHLWMDV